MKAAINSALLNPKVWFTEAFLLDNLCATKEKMSDKTSEKLCKASEINAKLPDKTPPITCAIVITELSRME
jgi:hypothetical protein